MKPRAWIWLLPGPLRRALAAAAGRCVRALPDDVVAHLAARLLPASIMTNKRYFHLWQEKGYHVTPVHYFELIPDTRALPDLLWSDPARYAGGIELREEEQVRLLARFQAAYQSEYSAFPRQPSHACEYYTDQGSFHAVDAEVLYCMVRHYRPRRVMEVGSGLSSLVITAALARNHQDCAEGRGRLVCVEPFPAEVLLRGQAEGKLTLMATPVQMVPLRMFEELSENDILFIDSTHVLRIGGDVEFLYLQVLPRLKPGVLVHIHDIFLPAEYLREWVLQGRLFWNEQYLLHAFLQCNREWDVLWGSSYMHLNHADALRGAFAVYDPKRDWPGSFWIRRKGGAEGLARPGPSRPEEDGTPTREGYAP